jgi:hypothetical protein
VKHIDIVELFFDRFDAELTINKRLKKPEIDDIDDLIEMTRSTISARALDIIKQLSVLAA